MPTTNKTSSSGVFNQQSMDTYNGMQSGISSNLQDFMKNPLQSSFFNTQMQMAQRGNQQRMQSQNQALLQNSAAGGFTGNLPAFMQSQLAQNSRQLSANNSNSSNNLLLGANQLRFGATQSAMGYKPLQTGSNQTQSQGGIGSWLAPIASMAIGAATGGMMGGGGGGGLGSSFFKGAGSGPQGFSTQVSGNPAPNFSGQMPSGVGSFNMSVPGQ